MRKSELLIKVAQIFMILVVLTIVLIGFLKDWDLLGQHKTVRPNPLTSHVILESKGALEQIWLRSEVFIEQDNIGLFLDASNGVLFILGALDTNANDNLIALNAKNGDLIWSNGTGTESSLRSSPSVIYTGTSNGGRVIAYDVQSGEKIWSEQLTGTRSIRRIYIVGNSVQVNASFEKFFILSSDIGEIIAETEYELGQDVFLIADQIVFQQSTFSILQAVNLAIDSPVWKVDLEEPFYKGPEFTEDIIFLRTGRIIGRVFAIDRKTGSILWQTDKIVISNIAVTEAAVYFLTLDGMLVEASSRNGRMLSSVRFASDSFILNGPENPTVGGYHVATDSIENLVYVALGDSAQLFAFKRIE